MPAGKANLGHNFYPKLIQVASRLGMKPEDLLAVMVSESGLNPSAYESKYKGSGLVGFMPDTLKSLKFPGTWKDFIKLSGEEQLDWLEKLVRGYSQTNGGPLTSAGQYYVANLWPVALKLPGVRSGDPSTPILEANPQSVTDKSGKRYSKKYYDIGIKISSDFESKAYHANPLFDKEKKGAITYGDMIRQAEINKKNPIYQQAIAAMRESTGYSPREESPTMMAKRDPKQITTPQSLMSTITNYLQSVLASEKQNKKLYKKYLPANRAVIQVDAGDYINSVEFARILCAALGEELMALAFPHTDGTSVEIDCTIYGPGAACFHAIEEVTNSVSEAFKIATKKIGGVTVKTNLIINKTSSYQEINPKAAINQHRKFLLKFI